MKLGYQLTEVGIIPEDWGAASIGEVATKVGSGITPTGGNRVYKQEGRPFLRSQNVGWSCLFLDDIAFIDEVTHSTFAETEIKIGDIFLNITGASIGRSSIADFRVEGGNVNQHVCIIRTDECLLVPRFLNLILLSSLGQKQIDSFQAGGNRQGLNFSQVRSISIPLPPLSEQRSIATTLSDMDELLGALDRLIAKKCDLKQAAMQQLLTGKTRLPRFSEGEWVTKQQKEVCSYTNGRAYQRTEWESHGTPVVRLQNLTGSGDEYYYSNLNLPEHQYVDYGDLIFMWSASFGPYIWKGEKAIYHYHIWKITCDSEEVDKTFYYYKLAELTENIKKGSNGSTMAHVTKGEMENYSITLPKNIEEQRKIATILSDMDAEIISLEQRRDKTRALKQAMMQELLTGKTRLI